MLASPNGPAIFPAARTTNRSPKVWSKTDSGGTRLSEQLSTVAFGCCDFVSDSRTLTTARGFSLPATKRLLPSIRSDQILSGDCVRLVGYVDTKHIYESLTSQSSRSVILRCWMSF